MKLEIWAFLVFTFLFLQSITAQPVNESCKKNQEISRIIESGKYNVALFEVESILKNLSENKQKERVYCYYTMGKVYLRKGLTDSASVYYSKGDTLLIKHSSDELMSISHENKAAIFMKKHKTDRAMTHLLKAIDYAEKSGDDRRIIQSNINMGILFLEKKALTKSQKYLIKARDLALENDEENLVQLCDFHLSRILVEEKKYKEAENNFSQIIKYAESTNNNELLLITKGNLGRVYLFTNRLKEATEISMQALALANQMELGGTNKKILDNTNKIKNLEQISSDSIQEDSLKSLAMHMLKDKKNAEVNFQQREMLVHVVNQDTNMLNSTEKKLVMDTSIMAEVGKTIALQDSLYQNSLKEKYTTYETLYETNKKQVENDKLTQINQAQAAENRKSNRYKWILGIGALCLLVMSFFLWNRFSNERKHKQKIATQYALNQKLHRELHHRMKNNLSVIDLFITLAKEKFDDDAYQEKLTELQNRINSMFQVHTQLFDQENMTEINAQKYTNALAQNVMNAYKTQISFENQTHETEKLSSGVAIPMGFAINEFMTNSYKHAFPDNHKGKITMNLSSNEQQYTLLLKDNGIGLPHKFSMQNLETFGIETIQNIVKQYHGKFRIWNENGVCMKIQLDKLHVES